MELNATKIVDRLGARIAQLEVDKAVLEAQVEELSDQLNDATSDE